MDIYFLPTFQTKMRQVPKCHKVWKYNTTKFDSEIPQSLEVKMRKIWK